MQRYQVSVSFQRTFLPIPKLVATPLLSLKRVNVLLVRPGITNLHLKSCLCPWNLLPKASLDVPKPVATFYYLKKLNVRVVALACPICI